MKAIFIDSKNRKISEVEIPKQGTLKAWYKVIGCEIVEVATYINSHNDSILVDEEGLIKEINPDSPFFIYSGSHQPFAGNGLIIGVDKEGESISHHTTVEEVESKVTFYTYDQLKKG